jgi:hypothetical protein
MRLLVSLLNIAITSTLFKLLMVTLLSGSRQVLIIFVDEQATKNKIQSRKHGKL